MLKTVVPIVALVALFAASAGQADDKAKSYTDGKSYADKAAEKAAKGEFQNQAEKALEHAREAGEAKATTEGNRAREAANLDHNNRLSVGEGKSIGVSHNDIGTTLNFRADTDKKSK